MFKKYVEKMKKPDFWIQDYWNAWIGPRMLISSIERRQGNLEDNIQKLRSARIPTFEEYVSIPERTYDGQRCDLSTVPQRFIDQNDRLVRIYNKLLQEEEIDIRKLKRVIKISGILNGKGYN